MDGEMMPPLARCGCLQQRKSQSINMLSAFFTLSRDWLPSLRMTDAWSRAQCRISTHTSSPASSLFRHHEYFYVCLLRHLHCSWQTELEVLPAVAKISPGSKNLLFQMLTTRSLAATQPGFPALASTVAIMQCVDSHLSAPRHQDFPSAFFTRPTRATWFKHSLKNC